MKRRAVNTSDSKCTSHIHRERDTDTDSEREGEREATNKSTSARVYNVKIYMTLVVFSFVFSFLEHRLFDLLQVKMRLVICVTLFPGN